LAKISRVNIAITGDSKGLQAATDSARRELNRLNAAAETTNKKLKSFGESAMRTQGALGQFGVGGKGLGMLGGLAQVGAMGGLGLGLGAAGLALGAATMGIGAVGALPDVRRRATSALEETQMDQRRRIEDLGFSRMIAEQIAARAPLSTPGGAMGIGEAFSQGLATQGGSLAEVMINEVPKAIATELGALLGGASLAEAGAIGRSQMMTGNAMQDANRAIGLMNQMPSWTMDILRWMSK
jgi:hypothetical protein